MNSNYDNQNNNDILNDNFESNNGNINSLNNKSETSFGFLNPNSEMNDSSNSSNGLESIVNNSNILDSNENVGNNGIDPTIFNPNLANVTTQEAKTISNLETSNVLGSNNGMVSNEMNSNTFSSNSQTSNPNLSTNDNVLGNNINFGVNNNVNNIGTSMQSDFQTSQFGEISNQSVQNNKNKRQINYKKLGILILILLVIGVVAFFIIKRFSKPSDTVLTTLFNLDQPIKVRKDGKFGYIDTKGNFVVEPIYDGADAFLGDYAIVRKKEMINGKEKSVYKVIDKKGNVQVSSEYSEDIKFIPEYNIWIVNDQLFDSSFKKLTSDNVEVKYEDGGYLRWTNDEENTAGIMNSSGKITYTYKFSEGESYLGLSVSEAYNSLKDKYCMVSIELDKYAIVNCETGKVIYDFTDKYIYAMENNIFEVTDEASGNFISIMYIEKDKIIYQSSSEVDLSYYTNGYLRIEDYNKDYDDWYTYYDIKTGETTKTAPKLSYDTSSLSEWEILTGFTEFDCGTYDGLMEGKEILLACEWNDIDYFDVLLYQYLKSDGKEYIMAQKDKKTYLINLKNGKTVSEFNSDYIYDDSNSTFIYYTDKDTEQKVVYNLLTGKTISVKSNYVNIYFNYATVEIDKKIYYYNTDLELIYTQE